MIRRSVRFGLLAAALLLLSGVLAGCAGNQAALTGASWPGISTGEEQELVYVAFGPGVYAVDPETGAEVWTYPAEPERGRTFYAPPAVSDDMVVVGDYDNTLVALNPDTGAPIWTFESDRSPFIGSATISNGLVYAGSADGVVHALNPQNGSEVWSFEADQGIWAEPLVVEDTLYIPSLDKHLYALDAETGELRWRFPDSGDSLTPPMGAIVSAPTYYEGLLLFGSFNNRLYALDVESREVVWQYEATNWVWGSPAVDEATGTLVAADLDGHVFALDVETGDELWTTEVSGRVVGSPVLVAAQEGETAVFVGSGDPAGAARLYKLNLETGQNLVQPGSVEVEFASRFLFFETGTNRRTVPLNSTPVALGDVVLVGSHEGDAPLHALDAGTLLGVWSFEPVGS